MNLEISWVTIGKLALAGAFTYVVAPALLLFRDLFLFWCIRKFVLNDKLHILIKKRASDVWQLKNKLNHKMRVHHGANSTNYYINDEEVEESKFLALERARDFHIERSNQAATQIVWRSNLIGLLFRHYKQDPD